MDNTKRRAGGPCCQMKNMNFLGAGELHRRPGQWVAEMGGPEGCAFLQAGLSFFVARRTALLCSPPDRLFVKPTSPLEVARVTFSDSDSAPVPKFVNPGPAIFQI